MKKIYLSFIALFMWISAISQITITAAANAPQVGDSFEFIHTPSFSFNVSQSGANQTWDFSSATGTSYTTTYVNLAASGEPASFPSANLVEQVSGAENIVASFTTNRGGTTTITADGYGSLILPYTTVPNVLRVLAVK